MPHAINRIGPIMSQLLEQGLGHPLPQELVDEIGRALYELGQEKGLIYTAICGVPGYGAQFARAIQNAAQEDRPSDPAIPLLELAVIEGRIVGPRIDPIPPRSGAVVLLVCDKISKPRDEINKHSGITRSLGVLREQGFEVLNLIAFLDADQGTSERILDEQRCYVHAVITANDLLLLANTRRQK